MTIRCQGPGTRTLHQLCVVYSWLHPPFLLTQPNLFSCCFMLYTGGHIDFHKKKYIYARWHHENTAYISKSGNLCKFHQSRDFALFADVFPVARAVPDTEQSVNIYEINEKQNEWKYDECVLITQSSIYLWLLNTIVLTRRQCGMTVEVINSENRLNLNLVSYTH